MTQRQPQSARLGDASLAQASLPSVVERVYAGEPPREDGPNGNRIAYPDFDQDEAAAWLERFPRREAAE